MRLLGGEGVHGDMVDMGRGGVTMDLGSGTEVHGEGEG